MTHVFHVSEEMSMTYGGPANSIPNLSNALNKINVSNEILSTYISSASVNSVISAGNITWSQFPGRIHRKLRFSNEMEKYLRKEVCKYDSPIIHVHNLWNAVPFHALKVSKQLGIPLVVSPRGMLRKEALRKSKLLKNVAWKLFVEDLLKLADVIHATDNVERDEIHDLGIKSKIEIIPNGIDLQKYETLPPKGEAEKSLGINSSRRFLYLSRILPHKNLDRLVRSWVELDSEWDLVVAGPVFDLPYWESIKEYVRAHNKQDKFFYLGIVGGDEKLNALSASDVLVLPSDSENFGMAIAEALASGVPVITTQGTPWQSINEIEAGWWVENNDEELLKSMKHAIEIGGNARAAMGANAMALINDYSLENISHKYKSMYEEIAS